MLDEPIPYELTDAPISYRITAKVYEYLDRKSMDGSVYSVVADKHNTGPADTKRVHAGLRGASKASNSMRRV